MRYHIYYSQSLFQSRHYWDVDENFVKQIVKAYLRGENEVVINGEKYIVGSLEFLIYENPPITNTLASVLGESIYKAEGAQNQFSKEFFRKKFKNVTDQFLLGRIWGEQKDDFFNIYINDGQSKPVILVLSKHEVESFLDDWANGGNPIWTSGRRIDLDNPKSIKIYSINFEWLSKDRGDTKSNIKKYVDSIHHGVYKIEALEYFGKDITDKWEVRPYGKSKNKTISFDWGQVHPIILRVAKPRFTSHHFADAVEAAFKEINEIIKTEYKKVVGTEEDGTALMRKAFAHTNPVFRLTNLSTESLKNIQEGYMNIFAGAIIGIRNPKAHANIQIDEQDAWEKIILASHMLKMWDNRIV
jgi:uncharacterized protein (TIGR02391 family)